MKIIYCLPLLFLACNDNSNPSEKTSKTSSTETTITTPAEKPSATPEPKPADDGHCYWQILQRDTFVASFDRMGDQVSGKLVFDNFEKDGSSGRITGKTEDGILKLWYNFESEGMKSIMQVWFKKEGNRLLRGTGDMKVNGDSSFFSDASKVSYGGTQDLQKVGCSDVPAKYK